MKIDYTGKNFLSFSGGVDSAALALHLNEIGIKYTPVFCDTLWEHPETIRYIEYFNDEVFKGSLITLKSLGMVELVKKKKRAPSAKARFCTEELKVKPMINFVAEQEIDVIFQGIRGDESKARSKMEKTAWSDAFDCYVDRPIFDWKKTKCFDILTRHGIKQNPLYLKGAGRVGCFPCVMVNHQELKRFSEFYPEIWDRIRLIESINNRSFFAPGYIPDRFCTGWCTKSERPYPLWNDVQRYLDCTPEQLEKKLAQCSFIKYDKCTSIYNLCE